MHFLPAPCEPTRDSVSLHREDPREPVAETDTCLSALVVFRQLPGVDHRSSSKDTILCLRTVAMFVCLLPKRRGDLYREVPRFPGSIQKTLLWVLQNK